MKSILFTFLLALSFSLVAQNVDVQPTFLGMTNLQCQIQAEAIFFYTDSTMECMDNTGQYSLRFDDEGRCIFEAKVLQDRNGGKYRYIYQVLEADNSYHKPEKDVSVWVLMEGEDKVHSVGLLTIPDEGKTFLFWSAKTDLKEG